MLETLKRKMGSKLTILALNDIRFGTGREIERGLTNLRLALRVMPTCEDRKWVRDVFRVNVFKERP